MVTLQIVDAEFLQLHGSRAVLDHFRHGLDAESLRKPDQGPGENPFPRPGRQATHERSVDLDHIDGKAFRLRNDV